MQDIDEALHAAWFEVGCCQIAHYPTATLEVLGRALCLVMCLALFLDPASNVHAGLQGWCSQPKTYDEENAGTVLFGCLTHGNCLSRGTLWRLGASMQGWVLWPFSSRSQMFALAKGLRVVA